MSQLPDDYVQELLETIAEKGKVFAQAKAYAKSMEEARKVTKAALMRLARLNGGARSREAAEVDAYTHPQYAEVSKKMIQAIEDEVTAEVDYENSIRSWESWRSLLASERAALK